MVVRNFWKSAVCFKFLACLCHYRFLKIHCTWTLVCISSTNFVIFTFPYPLLVIYNQILDIFDNSGLWRNVTTKSYVTPGSHCSQLTLIILKLSVQRGLMTMHGNAFHKLHNLIPPNYELAKLTKRWIQRVKIIESTWRLKKDTFCFNMCVYHPLQSCRSNLPVYCLLRFAF